METAELSRYGQPGGPLYGIHASNHGRVIIFAGGIPIRQNGEIVGAIGVSSGSEEQGTVCAQAGAEAFTEQITEVGNDRKEIGSVSQNNQGEGSPVSPAPTPTSFFPYVSRISP